MTMDPVLKDAHECIKRMGLADREPEHAGPLPADPYQLASILQHARGILSDIRLLEGVSDAETRAEWEADEAASFAVALQLHHGLLIQALLATRPWDGVEPEELGITPEDVDHWLVPLALALATVWRRYWPGESPLERERRQATVRDAAVARGWTEDEAKVEATRRAILVVQHDRKAPTDLRIGSHGSTRRDVSPYDDLKAVEYLRWWRPRVHSEAEDILAEMADSEMEGAGLTVEDDVEPDALPSPAGSPLDALAAESSVAARLGSLQAVARPAERKALDALLGHLRRGLDMAEAEQAAADELEVTVDTIRRYKRRVRDRVS